MPLAGAWANPDCMTAGHPPPDRRRSMGTLGAGSLAPPGPGQPRGGGWIVVVGVAVVELVGMTVITAVPWFVVGPLLGDPMAESLVSDFRRYLGWLCGFAAAPTDPGWIDVRRIRASGRVRTWATTRSSAARPKPRPCHLVSMRRRHRNGGRAARDARRECRR